MLVRQRPGHRLGQPPPTTIGSRTVCFHGRYGGRMRGGRQERAIDEGLRYFRLPILAFGLWPFDFLSVVGLVSKI